MTTLAWNEVAKIAKKLQKQYKLPIFAMTYKGTCSCCASPKELNATAYLTKDVRDLDWKDIDSYIIFKNAHNGHGEARLTDKFCYTREYKYAEYREQYVGYKLSDTFTMEKLHECLTRLVDEINAQSTTQYSLQMPEDDFHCAVIKRIDSRRKKNVLPSN